MLSARYFIGAGGQRCQYVPIGSKITQRAAKSFVCKAEDQRTDAPTDTGTVKRVCPPNLLHTIPLAKDTNSCFHSMT